MDDPHAPAITALRIRMISRFTELEAERAQITTELDALHKQQATIPEPGLLDALPILGDILHRAPAASKSNYSPPSTSSSSTTRRTTRSASTPPSPMPHP